MQIDTNYPPMLENLAQIAEKNGLIDPELYTKYDVKRGLRDANGRITSYNVCYTKLLRD